MVNLMPIQLHGEGRIGTILHRLPTLPSTGRSNEIRLSCHVISLPTCTIGADRPTRNNRNGSHRLGSQGIIVTDLTGWVVQQYVNEVV